MSLSTAAVVSSTPCSVSTHSRFRLVVTAQRVFWISFPSASFLLPFPWPSYYDFSVPWPWLLLRPLLRPDCASPVTAGT